MSNVRVGVHDRFYIFHDLNSVITCLSSFNCTVMSCGTKAYIYIYKTSRL